MLDQVQLWLYHMQQTASQWTAWQLQHLSPLSLLVMIGAGLLSSLSPCMLSMLPVMVGYVGGYGSNPRTQTKLTLGFSLGVATTLMLLGLAAALLGKLYGQMGSLGGPIVGGVILLMGLNLLELVQLPLPALFGNVQVSETLTPWLRAYSIGLLFGVTASPCSTPVLVAILAWVSQTRDPWVGGLLLLSYAVGLLLPLVVVGFFTGLLTRLLSLRRWGSQVVWLSGIVLVVVGTLMVVQPILTWVV
ncbi:MAG: cytochrome c biogenesis CcdA family protein [Thermostichales cyanobacterium DRC_bins_46]